MKKISIFFLCLSCIFPLCAQDKLVPPRDSVPEDHLAWFCLKGPVREVREYDYNNWSKTVWSFDPQGRLIEYTEYLNPFFESGGCVFGLWAHYRYAYDEDGKIMFLETYNADYNTVDDFADLTLELFPPQCKGADLFPKAEKEYGDTTYCFSLWKDVGDTQHYYGYRFDRYGNLIESASVQDGDYENASVRVREISYYR